MILYYRWIPEAPDHPGVYANASDVTFNGKISVPTHQPSTTNIHNAIQFETYEECKQWCNSNPYPKFIPVEHGFCDDPFDLA